MKHNTHLTLRLPAKLVERLDSLVGADGFSSRSEAVRAMLKVYIFEEGKK